MILLDKINLKMNSENFNEITRSSCRYQPGLKASTDATADDV